ncbi:MAG: hypothetical protein JWM95_2111 [Gemmatimonadetes bacterium]|nr:hypothetical protein [Gemmatimonadota bacterium]
MTDGYDYRFDSAAFDAVVRFVANERACCPFLSFALRIAADAGPIWLAVTGPAGTQSLLDAELR